METNPQSAQPLEQIARRFAHDLRTIGNVSYVSRLHGYALFDDGVMFGFVEPDGTPYLRTTSESAKRFHALGSVKHPEMPYWSVPLAAHAEPTLLRELAYEAADTAHIAASFGIDEAAQTPTGATISILSAVSKTVLAA